MQPPCFCAFPKMQEKMVQKNAQNNLNHFNLRFIPECGSKGTSNIKSYFNSLIASGGGKKKKLDWGNLTGQAADVMREGCFLTTRLQPNTAHQHVSAFSHRGGAQAERGSRFHPDWVKSPPLKGECKCVIYTCLVFYHDKAVHTPGKGGEEKRGQSLHSSPVLFHSRACDSLSCSSQRPSRGPAPRPNKSLIFCFFPPPFFFFLWFHSSLPPTTVCRLSY